jgi:hypothetical protein
VFSGFSYLVASLIVAGLLRFAGNQRHETREKVDIYRYPSLLLRAIIFFTPVYGVVAMFIYHISPQKPSGPGLLIFVLLFGGLMIANTFSYLYFKHFSIEMSDEAFTIRTLMRVKTVPFSEVRRVLVIHGARSGTALRLAGRSDEKLLKIGSSLEDFDSLVWLVKKNAHKRGIAVRERDRAGKWSESVN